MELPVYHKGPGNTILCDDVKCRGKGCQDNFYFITDCAEATRRGMAALNATHGLPVELLEDPSFAIALQATFGGENAATEEIKEALVGICNLRLVQCGE